VERTFSLSENGIVRAGRGDGVSKMSTFLEHRYFHWQNRSVPQMPLSLQDLPLTQLPLEYIDESCRGVNVSRTQIVDPHYPSTLPSHVLSLEHGSFQGTTLYTEHTRLGNLTLARCPDLETLGPLPPTLRRLTISDCPKFVTLPELPPRLEWLCLTGCEAFSTLPALPASLKTLSVVCTGVQRLPLLPEDIEAIYIPHEAFEARLLNFQWTLNSSFGPRLEPPVHKRVDILRSLGRTIRRTHTLKEDLMMAAWHPRRVSKWLEAGEEVLDSMMGC
jgi:hypothetical protein